MRDRLDALLLVTAAGFACVAAAAAVSPEPETASAVPAVEERTSPPGLVPAQTIIDVGQVGWGEVGTGGVTLRNAAATPAEVVATGKECGCTNVRLTRRTIPPGVEAELFVDYDPGRGDGPVRKRVSVTYRLLRDGSGDGAVPGPLRRVTLGVAARVIPPFRLHPPSLTLGPTVKEAVVSVAAAAASSAEIERIDFNPKSLSTEPVDGGGLRVRFDAARHDGTRSTEAAVAVRFERPDGTTGREFVFLPVKIQPLSPADGATRSAGHVP